MSNRLTQPLLVMPNGKTLLIDSGKNGHGQRVKAVMDRAGVTTFEDKWEGSLGGLDAIEREKAAGTYSKKKLGPGVSRYEVLPQHAPSNTFINCWHLNDDESDAMWTIYATKQYGVAITSTITRLSRALKLPTSSPSHMDVVKRVRIAPVEYVDYKILATHFDPGRLFLYKRKSFAHEREVRLYTRADREGFASDLTKVVLPVDKEELIMGVYVSPYAQGWFKDVVQAVIDRFGPTITVQQSDHKADPIR